MITLEEQSSVSNTCDCQAPCESIEGGSPVSPGTEARPAGRTDGHERVRGGAATERDHAVCSACSDRKADSDGLCRYCRLQKFRALRIKACPPITPAILQELRCAYVGNVREVSANLNRISRRTGIPKARLKAKANEQGCRVRVAQHRQWTPEETAYLRDHLGDVSVTKIARRLKRSVLSIKCRAKKLERSCRVLDGYNVSALCGVFGLSHSRVESWIRRGLLGKAEGHGGHGGDIRFKEKNVIKFIRQYPAEYELSRVDQLWFKSMVFGVRCDY